MLHHIPSCALYGLWDWLVYSALQDTGVSSSYYSLAAREYRKIGVAAERFYYGSKWGLRTSQYICDHLQYYPHSVVTLCNQVIILPNAVTEVNISGLVSDQSGLSTSAV